MEENNKNKSGMTVASLTLGIISIVTALFWYGNILILYQKIFLKHNN